MKVANTRIVSVGATSGPIVDPSPMRVALVFFSASNQRYTISTSSPVALDQGPTIQQGTAPLHLWEEYHGDAVKRQWFGIAPAAITVGIIEVMSDGK